MDVVTKIIMCSEEALTLTNQRAIFWERESALILSDLHIGKTAHFRKNGIPIPKDILEKDLNRLSDLISLFNVEKIIIVGDLFHAEANNDLLFFQEWLKNHALIEIILVKGNHDKITKHVSQLFNNIYIVSNLTIRPFRFVHHPWTKDENSFIISGHTHPGVLIKGNGKQRIKLPSYQVNNNQLILPAFSLFTGLNTTKDSADFINYAFTDEEIFKVELV
ncbi:ligase-associated DNA damage response endonuclease PdeM [Aureibaculum sp. 2210JD6-5]|uniref:ligase-associated DNA damage response endonuclease PdeM n=1 Tax=Aureibaculum sp. 2210JD6-5 TaxID=3103957 RepID=UPI002AAD4881|nr:ligase-associated DNA damage response endonuclease PdeM [Aureibaculum sp. 2210JD6-5]MDY7394977.1 ligase-associated DNA damage response endonuclease PdeM [Aureibaculum sp. 2210JD6-5]